MAVRTTLTRDKLAPCRGYGAAGRLRPRHEKLDEDDRRKVLRDNALSLLTPSACAMPEPRPATILHISDCHLDDEEDSRHRRAFASAIDLSIELDVALVLITGDLFDHSRVRDPLLEWTAEGLDRSDRPVVLIVGNHDCLNETSVHHRFSAGSRCKQVTFLDNPDGVSVEVPGTDIVVWGKAMVAHEVGYRPLAGAPGRLEGRWNVVAAHGLVMDGRVDSRRSSPILTEDLDGIDADYVALGHIHTFPVIRRQPLTAYAGATESSMTGQPGAVVVDLRPGCPPTLRWQALPIGSGAD